MNEERIRRRGWIVGLLLGLALAGQAAAAPVSGATRVRMTRAYGELPLLFERNEGQTDPAVDFLCRAGGMTLWLAGGESVIELRGHEDDPASVVRLRLAGAAGHPEALGERRQAARTNYLLGADPARWHTGVANFAAVRYRGVYPGIDLVYHGDRRRLEYDFEVAPGARAERIQLRVSGAEQVELGDDGALRIRTAAGVLTQPAPVAWQDGPAGRTPVAVRYAMEPPAPDGAREVRLVIGDHNPGRRLLIDPVLSYGTFLGSTDEDLAYGIAVDASGNAYVTGIAHAGSFPTTSGALQETFAGGTYDAFVSKLDPTGSTLLYSTFLGGTNSDEAHGIAVDAGGDAYVVGYTQSPDFPTTAGAPQTVPPGGTRDAFVSRLDATGSSLVYSTYLGGSDRDYGRTIAVGAGDDAWVAGETFSADFPTSSGALQETRPGSSAAFVTRLDTAAVSPVISTYLGGTATEVAFGIAVDAAGNSTVTGRTYSDDFPVSAGAFQTTRAGDSDAFVTRLTPSLDALVFSTYLGGADSSDTGRGVALDASGDTYLVGETFSTDFPTTVGAFQTVFAGLEDVFVARLDATGSSLVYSTYVGSTSQDRGGGIAVDADGNAWVTGETAGLDFPVSGDALQPSHGGGSGDAFISQIAADGGSLPFSTYLGGGGEDAGAGIAVDASGAYMAGWAISSDFPTTDGSVQPVHADDGGDYDAVVVKLGLPAPKPLEVPTLSPAMLALLALALAGAGAVWLRRGTRTA